jgi:adenylyl cyclase-associated protein
VVVKPAVSKRPVETVKGTPKVEFIAHQSKWYVQYQSAGDGEVVVTINDKKESVYVLGCLGASITVVGKCNGIVVDNCKKTKVTFGTVMASCELVNCQRMHIVCTEKVSSVAIDKTDGAVVTLPKTSMDSEILSAKSSEMNVQWYDEEGELVERPIPEQYVHRIKDGAITANVSDLYH